MHIAVLTHNYPRFPGDFSGTFVQALCEELAAQGQRVTVWAPYDPAYQQATTDDRGATNGERDSVLGGTSDAHCVNCPPSVVTLRLYHYIWPPRLYRLGYMRSMQSDLNLQASAYWLGPLMLASGIAHLLRAARRDRPDVLHAHWLLPGGFVGAVVSRLLGIPLVISVPGSDARVAQLNPLFRGMARFAMNQASLLTANSAELRDAVVATPGPRGQDATAAQRRALLDKFDLILYGTDPDALRPDDTGVIELRAELGLEPQMNAHERKQPSDASRPHPVTGSSCPPVILLCVGRMVYKKGFDVLIRALAEPPLRDRNVVAVMVGEGDQKAEWQALAAQLGVADRLHWVGNVPTDRIGVYYNLCDVLVNPAVHKPADGLNVCVLDAMSCAKPVVGSDVAGNPLAIVDGETGFLVPERAPAALARALAQLADDPALRARMGAASRARIENELGWPHLARRYVAHFERLTG